MGSGRGDSEVTIQGSVCVERSSFPLLLLPLGTKNDPVLCDGRAESSRVSHQSGWGVWRCPQCPRCPLEPSLHVFRLENTRTTENAASSSSSPPPTSPAHGHASLWDILGWKDGVSNRLVPQGPPRPSPASRSLSIGVCGVFGGFSAAVSPQTGPLVPIPVAQLGNVSLLDLWTRFSLSPPHFGSGDALRPQNTPRR